MRSALTEISALLVSASVLIFISALVVPLLRESPSPSVNDDVVAFEAPAAQKKMTEELAPESMQTPAVENKLPSPTTPLQGEATPSLSNAKTEPTSPLGAPGLSTLNAPNAAAIDRPAVQPSSAQSQQSSAESPAPQSEEKPEKPADRVAAEEKSAPRHAPVSILVLGDGMFPPGEVTPQTDVKEAIDKIIPLIEARSPDKVVVEGHADNWISEGTSPTEASKWNKAVSLRRANAVARLLEQKGIARNRIIVNGLGDVVPLASNLTQEGRAKNRRVEIKLSPTP